MIANTVRAWIILLTLLVLVGLTYEPPVQAAGNAPEPCVLIGDTGQVHVWRCEDWEMGKLVYVNDYGFLFAVDE